MTTFECTTPARNRYAGFSSVGLKIHILKRFAARLAAWCPHSWRFRIFGLPLDARRRLNKVASDHQSFEVENGIACQNGAHLTARGQYIPEMTLGADSFMPARFLQKQKMFPQIHQFEGTVLSMASDGDINYYRWIMETLPRFRFIQEGKMVYDRFYCRAATAFQRSALELFLGEKSNVISSDDYRFIQAPQIIMPRFVNETEEWIIPWLRTTILPHAVAVAEPVPRRLYLTRLKACGRHVRNEKEVVALLERWGFVSVVLEDFSWLEQVALFNQAEAFVAPHGAGLANLVFASPGAFVVELIAPEYPFTFYPEISRRVGLEHHLVPSRAVELRCISSSSLEVDLDALKRVLLRMNAGESRPLANSSFAR